MNAKMHADFAKHGRYDDEVGDSVWTPGPLPGTALQHNCDVDGIHWMGLYVNECDMPKHVREWFDMLRPTNGIDPETGKQYEMPTSWLMPDGSRRYCLGRVVQWDLDPQPWAVTCRCHRN